MRRAPLLPLPALLLAAPPGRGSVAPSDGGLGPLIATLQTELNTAAASTMGQQGLTLGVATPGGGVISLSAGYAQFQLPVPDPFNVVDPTSQFALGSTTKMVTAAAVLRLVDEGRLRLDDAALPLMDPFYQKIANASLVDALGAQVRDVTVRQLLAMASGIPDFDDKASRDFQTRNPKVDMGPAEMFSFVKAGAPDCAPGKCREYSSTNYVLLGLVLAQHAGAASWDAYDLRSALPSELAARMKTATFALRGPCSSYPKMVHGYTPAPAYPAYQDVYKMSCTGGWTCGNMLGSGADAAVFVRELLREGGGLVSPAMREEMLDLHPLDKGWNVGEPYGLGLMDMSYSVGVTWYNRSFIGHGGETEGFNAVTGYAPAYDFGLSIAANTELVPAVNGLIAFAYNAAATFFGRKKPGPSPPAPPAPAAFHKHGSAYCGVSGTDAKRVVDQKGVTLPDCEARCAADSACSCYDHDQGSHCRTYTGHPKVTASSNGYDAYTRD